MSARRIIGLIILLGGIAMLFVSSYIKNQVIGGQKQVSSAQRKVNQAEGLFSLHPVAKDIGQEFTKGAQKKIKLAKEEIAHYAQLAEQLQIGGLIIIAAGVILILIPSTHKKGK